MEIYCLEGLLLAGGEGEGRDLVQGSPQWAKLLTGVLDSLTEQIAVLNRRGDIVAVNDSWVRFALENGAGGGPGGCSGAPANYLATCYDADGVCSEEALPAADGIRAVLEGRQSLFRLEYPCHSPLRQRWFLMSVTPLRQEEGAVDGPVVGAVVSHLLITDRILAEHRLRASEARLNMAQRLAHVGSFDRDLVSGQGVWSDELFRILGRQPGIMAPPFDEFLAWVHAEERQAVADFFELGRSTGVGFRLEFRVLRPDGEERWLAMVCDYVRDAEGRVVRHHGAIMDITERHRAEEGLRQLARTDPLTGLANRRSLLDALGQERERARRFGTPMSIIMADLDHFKAVNDTHGHAVGDRVLRHITGLLQESVRGVDTVGRMGGEEFCILLPQAGLAQGLEVAGRLVERARQTPYDLGAGQKLRQTVSCGVARFDGSESVDELLRRADAALYRAKSAGRDRAEGSAGAE